MQRVIIVAISIYLIGIFSSNDHLRDIFKSFYGSIMTPEAVNPDIQQSPLLTKADLERAQNLAIISERIRGPLQSNPVTQQEQDHENR